MSKKQNIAAMLDAFAGTTVCETRATSLVPITRSNKERLTAAAKAHRLSPSAFFCLAADEYITNHEW